MKVRVFAWARPVAKLPLKGLDHTFVTDYAPESAYKSITEVKKKGLNYWYCWGDFHSNNSSAIPQTQRRNIVGELSALRCICDSNDKNFTGTIKVYLKDGVCHQVSNQVLYMASPRIVVDGVKGYMQARQLYGHYGKNPADFYKIVNGCRAQRYSPNPVPSMENRMDSDDYMERLDNLLQSSFENGDDSEEMLKKERLFMIEERLGSNIDEVTKNNIANLMKEADDETEDLYAKLERRTISGKEYCELVNKVHQEKFQKIAKMIGPENYEKLFDCTPDETVDLGDPNLAAAIFDK